MLVNPFLSQICCRFAADSQAASVTATNLYKSTKKSQKVLLSGSVHEGRFSPALFAFVVVVERDRVQIGNCPSPISACSSGR